MSGETALQGPIDAAIERVRRVYGGWDRETTVEQMRRDWDDLFWSDAVEAAEEVVVGTGVSGRWLVPAGGSRERVLLYLHGGGFKLGSSRSHRDLAARLAVEIGCSALVVDYRLAPEHPFPAALEDALAAYRWLLGRGVEACDIVFAGYSAGGGLAISAMLSAREQGLALPRAAVLLSAWTDLTARRESYVTRAEADPIHQRGMVLATARAYVGAADPAEPLISPLFADLRGLPPLLIQVGDRETVLDDSRDFAEAARLAGVAVELEVYPGMIHVFQQFAPALPEALEAIAAIGGFVKRCWG